MKPIDTILKQCKYIAIEEGRFMIFFGCSHKGHPSPNKYLTPCTIEDAKKCPLRKGETIDAATEHF